MSLPSLNYVLITPARNEELNIEKIIHSVLSQTVVANEMGDRQRRFEGSNG